MNRELLFASIAPVLAFSAYATYGILLFSNLSNQTKHWIFGIHLLFILCAVALPLFRFRNLKWWELVATATVLPLLYLQFFS